VFINKEFLRETESLALASGRAVGRFRHINSAATNILAVTHVTVIDATGAAPLPDRTILITDDLITGPRRDP